MRFTSVHPTVLELFPPEETEGWEGLDRVQTSVTTIAKNKVLQKEAQKSVIKLWLQEKKNFSCGFLNEQ